MSRRNSLEKGTNSKRSPLSRRYHLKGGEPKEKMSRGGMIRKLILQTRRFLQSEENPTEAREVEKQ